MIAKELIHSGLLPLNTRHTVTQALMAMEAMHLHHLPLLSAEDGTYKGIVTEHELHDAAGNADLPLAELILELPPLAIHDKEHFYEVFRLIQKHRLTMLPVLDEKNNYIGAITKEELLDSFAAITSLEENGAIIVLEMNQNDYTMSEIAQIIESNSALILSSYITTLPNSMRMEVTLKINRFDCNDILATFERYQYQVKGAYSEATLDTQLKDRVDLLMNYLNL